MYKPIQIIGELDENIFYNEYSPSIELSEYVSCYWILKSKNPIHTEINHRILPDGCIDIIFDLQDNYSIIAGAMNQTKRMMLQGTLNTFGIRFLPKSIPFILKSNANEFLNNVFDAYIVCDELKDLINKVLHLGKRKNIYFLIEEELKNFFKKYEVNEKFIKILNLVVKSNGIIKVNEVSKLCGISERQISRYFKEYIGVSTKEFLTILRFQSILALMKKDNKISKEYLDFGYYDQSHMIKELKKFLL